VDIRGQPNISQENI